MVYLFLILFLECYSCEIRTLAHRVAQFFDFFWDDADHGKNDGYCAEPACIGLRVEIPEPYS